MKKLVFFLYLLLISPLVYAKDGIVICGQPGPLKNQRHFLENGLDRSLKLRNAYKRENKPEKVYWIIFNCQKANRGGYSNELLLEYSQKAKQENIEVLILSGSQSFLDWFNGRSIVMDSTMKISKLHYYGHATPGKIEIGYINSKIWNKALSKKLSIKKINPAGFAKNAQINVVGGCRTAIKPKLGGKSVAEKLLNLTEGTVLASDVRVFYPGGPVSDKTLLKKNNGKIVELTREKKS